MEKINKGISNLEHCISILQFTDHSNLDNDQVQLLAARIMTLSGKLNQFAYQMLYTLDKPDS